MKEQKFYICEHCGNIITKIDDSGVPVVCCGQKMTEIIPGTVEASREKHIPVVTRDGDKITVNVGSVTHPMTEEHSISWIFLKTRLGGQIKYLAPTDEPIAVFALDGDEPIAAYAYCNLHGLWRADI